MLQETSPMHRLIILVALMVMVLFVPATANAIDCARAASPTEKIICAKPELMRLDAALNKAYLTYAASQDKAGALKSQADWLHNTRDVCSDAACLEAAYKKRIEEFSRAKASPAAMSDSDFFKLCARDSLQQLKAAIKNRANVNAKDNDGKTPLMWAASDNPNPEVITALVEAGANVNTGDLWGETPLMYAAEQTSNPEVITALIKAGAAVNAQQTDDEGRSSGKTPLMWAAEQNSHPEVITALVKAGADVNARDMNGMTPLMLAYSPEIMAALLKAGADINATSDDGSTALMWETRATSQPELVTAFIAAGAKANTKNKYGETALTRVAAERDAHPEVIRVLIRAGADVNAQRNDDRRTPLMQAAKNASHPEVVATLLDLGANPKTKDRSGKMAVDYARKNESLKGTDALKKLEEVSR